MTAMVAFVCKDCHLVFLRAKEVRMDAYVSIIAMLGVKCSTSLHASVTMTTLFCNTAGTTLRLYTKLEIRFMSVNI